MMQSIVRCGFFDEQPASVIQEVAGLAFAITDGDAVAVFVIGVVGVGARHIPLADDPLSVSRYCPAKTRVGSRLSDFSICRWPAAWPSASEREVRRLNREKADTRRQWVLFG
ncbi:hypothetical protein RC84_17260 [Pectobacterium carotovorum subsp. carotovorum]|nr:hypothetical protein RC84_17260 [Pectobacterium carotovorum subsp. carotovorum]